MPVGSYERYGLTGNPFRELASENLDDVTIYHVNQTADGALHTLQEEVLDRENRAVVAVTGVQGSGKTQRLLLAAAEARERKAFHVYFDISSKTPWVLRGLADAFQKAAKDAGHIKMLGAPGWLRPLTAIAKSKKEEYDPNVAGRLLGEALNATAPSFLLLNDVHNLVEMREVDMFAKTLEEITAVMKPGVLIMFTCYASYLAWLNVNHPSLASRINRTIQLQVFSDDEARLVLAKKLLAKRIVEELEPTYPFDKEAVHELNVRARGNPRRLLEYADAALERGVETRAYQIDGELVRSVFARTEGVTVGMDLAGHGAPSEPAAPVDSAETIPEPPGAGRRPFWRTPKK
ncbi:MAG TPA: hypothetical protein VML94_05425 [Thermoplasmata archaeon]|nr:hypothetical protein [Thermoplasmata archaeon]